MLFNEIKLNYQCARLCAPDANANCAGNADEKRQELGEGRDRRRREKWKCDLLSDRVIFSI